MHQDTGGRNSDPRGDLNQNYLLVLESLLWSRYELKTPLTWEKKYSTKSRMHRLPGSVNPRRNTPRHIVIKLTKIKDKDKILKVTREKWQITYKGTSHHVISKKLYKKLYQQKLYKQEGNGMIYLKLWKGRTYSQEYSTRQDSPSDLMEKLKPFQTDKS